MAYTLDWTKSSPGHVVYLIDLSGSMKENSKIAKAMDALGKCLYTLVVDAEDGTSIRELLTVSIIGYHSKVVHLTEKPLSCADMETLVNDTIDAETPKPIFDYSEGKIAEPKWQTYMSKAFNAARMDIEQWLSISKGRQQPAPIVINITDGQPEEEGKSLELAATEALEAAKELKKLATPDGNVLLYNIHISSLNNEKEIILPSTLPDPTGDYRENLRIKFLFECSSQLPLKVMEKAKKELAGTGATINSNSRGMISNISDKALLVRILNFATCSTRSKSETPMPR